MEKKEEKILDKLKWNPPEIFILSAKKTEGGGNPAATETTIGQTAGS